MVTHADIIPFEKDNVELSEQTGTFAFLWASCTPMPIVFTFCSQMQCSYGDADGLEFALDGRMYELDYQLVDGDVDLPEYALSGSDVNSQGIEKADQIWLDSIGLMNLVS